MNHCCLVEQCGPWASCLIGYQCQPRRKFTPHPPPARRGQPFRNDTCNEDEIDSGADLFTSSTKTTIEYEKEIDPLKQQNKKQNDKINSPESEYFTLKTEKKIWHTCYKTFRLPHKTLYWPPHVCIVFLDI